MSMAQDASLLAPLAAVTSHRLTPLTQPASSLIPINERRILLWEMEGRRSASLFPITTAGRHKTRFRPTLRTLASQPARRGTAALIRFQWRSALCAPALLRRCFADACMYHYQARCRYRARHVHCCGVRQQRRRHGVAAVPPTQQ